MGVRGMLAQRHGWSGTRAATALRAVGVVGVVGAVGAAMIAMTGCSEGGAAASDRISSDPLTAVRQSADVLARSGTSKAVTSMEMASGGTRVTIDGKGRFDYGRRVGQLDIRLPKGASGAAPGERRPVIELITPGALYMKNRGAGVPSDKWVRIDTADLSDGNLVTSGATDPVMAAELLRGARQVSYEGRRQLRDGVTVRRYRGVLGLRDAAGAASRASRPQMEAAAKGFAKDTVAFVVELDEQGRLRTVRHDFTVLGGSGGSGGSEGSGGSAGSAGQAGGAADADGAGGPRGDSGSGTGAGVAVSSTTRLYAFGTPVKPEMPKSRDIYAGKVAEQ